MLTSADEDASAASSSGVKPMVPWIVDWMDQSAGMDVVEKRKVFASPWTEPYFLSVVQPIDCSLYSLGHLDADRMKPKLYTYKTVRRRKICTSLAGIESSELKQAIEEAGGKEMLSIPLPRSQICSLYKQALLFRFMDRVSSLIPWWLKGFARVQSAFYHTHALRIAGWHTSSLTPWQRPRHSSGG
jgi:hypothetical protein